MTLRPANRFVNPWVYAPSATGAPAPGDRLYFFASGTSEPLAVYSDANLSIEIENYVEADQDGIWPEIFLANASYKVMWTDSTGANPRVRDPVAPFIESTTTNENTIVIEFTKDGNGGIPPIGTGNGSGDLYVPFDCTITGVVIQADQAGTLEVDIWANPFATNAPPTATDSIVASAPPTLAEQQSSIDTTLTGWSVDLLAGTALRFNINEIDDVTRFTLSLVCTKATVEQGSET